MYVLFPFSNLVSPYTSYVNMTSGSGWPIDVNFPAPSFTGVFIDSTQLPNTGVPNNTLLGINQKEEGLQTLLSQNLVGGSILYYSSLYFNFDSSIPLLTQTYI